MLSVSMTESQQVVIKVPMTGKSKTGKVAKLEGPAEITIDPGSADVATVELDPADATGSTVVVKSIVSDTTEGDGPWLITGTIGRDARIGEAKSLITSLFAVEIKVGDAVAFELTAAAPTEKP